MAKKNLIYEAIDDFYLNGVFIARGNTVVGGHELLKGRSKLFRPFVPTYGELVEDEPAKAPKADTTETKES